MSELTPEAVALLEAARQGHGPSDNDRRRVLATLHASLGIGVPIALAPAAAEALASGQGAASASAAQGGAAALQASGSAAHQAASALSSAAHGAGTSAVAAGHSAKGALSLAGKLLSWKAGKLLLTGVALSSAVGIGVSVAPRRAPDVQSQLSGKSGQAAAFATDLRSRPDQASAVTYPDAGKSSSPSPAPAPEREPTAVAAAPAVTVLPALDAPSALEPALPAPQSKPVVVTRTATHAKYSSARSHRRHAVAGSRAESRASTRTVTAERSASTAPPSADKPAADEPVAQPLAASVPPSVPPSAPVELEAPNELALIRRAMTSLRDRDANRALALLEEHAARFPRGSFATERRGLHVVALCAAGRLDDGRREQAAFLKSAGSSPIAARVRGACNERGD